MRDKITVTLVEQCLTASEGDASSGFRIQMRSLHQVLQQNVKLCTFESDEIRQVSLCFLVGG